MLEHHFLDMAAQDQAFRHAELRAQAARGRVAAQRPRTPGFALRALAALGARLVSAGLALQRMGGVRPAMAGTKG